MVLSILCAANAQTWIENAPEMEYLAAQCKLVTSPTSACNKGTEPFRAFIKKFKSSHTFRMSRLKKTSQSIPADIDLLKSSLEALDFMCTDNDFDFPVGKKPGFIGTWYGVTANQVCYRAESFPVSDEEEWGGSTTMCCFQRIGGKWYVTGIALAG